MAISDRVQAYARIFRELPREEATKLLAAMTQDPQLSGKSEVMQGVTLATFANRMWPKEETPNE